MIELQTFTDKGIVGLVQEGNAVVTRPQAVSVRTRATPKPMLRPVSDRLLYGAKVHAHLKTIRPFDVAFRRNEQGFSAVVEDIEEYGIGLTRSDALEDLRATIQELYFSLEKEQARLSGDLPAVWSKLQAYLQREHK